MNKAILHQHNIQQSTIQNQNNCTFDCHFPLYIYHGVLYYIVYHDDVFCSESRGSKIYYIERLQA
jgi:hypothetical protein